jgi:hypothetical protein
VCNFLAGTTPVDFERGNEILGTVAPLLVTCYLGSVLNGVYSSSFSQAAVSIAGLPKEMAELAGDSVGVAMTIAGKLPQPLAQVVDPAAGSSLMDAWQVMTYVSCGISIIAALLVIRLMPAQHEDVEQQTPAA